MLEADGDGSRAWGRRITGGRSSMFDRARQLTFRGGVSIFLRLRHDYKGGSSTEEFKRQAMMMVMMMAA